jgi:F0F1-type ATP synthase delta subunit
MEQYTLTIPSEIISPTDIARLLRETENLDEFFRQAAIRQGRAPQSTPRYSRLLDTIVVANELNLLQSDDRQKLLASMKELVAHAPIMHISFSVDPPGAYVQKIVDWLRSNIDGRILVRVGLQPSIGAGCVVRTTNKSFDFSLRRFFDNKKEFFAQKLHEVVSADAGHSVTGTNTSELDQVKKTQVDIPSGVTANGVLQAGTGLDHSQAVEPEVPTAALSAQKNEVSS